MPSNSDTRKTDDMAVAHLQFDDVENALLRIARHFFIAYSDHAQPHWETAFDLSQHHFGSVKGPAISFALLNVLRTMRTSRKTTFGFTNPHCSSCRHKISNCERLLLTTIQHMRNGEKAKAQMDALIVCEGFDTTYMLKAVQYLSNLLQDFQTCSSQEPARC